MKAIKFKEANKKLFKPKNMTDKECGSLYVFNDNKQTLSCWKASIWARLAFLFHGKVWLSVCSGKNQPPVWVQCRRTVFEKKGE